MAMKEVMLTTTDNPFDPFTQWDDWYNYDLYLDHGCCELIGRLGASSIDASPASQQREYESTIDNIIKHDPLHIYKKVSREIPDDGE